MKKDLKKSLIRNSKFISTFLLLFLTIGCEKSVFDYRHKYVGDWNFEVIEYQWCMYPYPSGWSQIDTIFYTGDISYGDEKSELLVNYKSNKSIVISINKDGIVEGSYEESGQFDDKEHLSLTLRSSQSMLGAGYTITITGWK